MILFVSVRKAAIRCVLFIESVLLPVSFHKNERVSYQAQSWTWNFEHENLFACFFIHK